YPQPNLNPDYYVHYYDVFLTNGFFSYQTANRISCLTSIRENNLPFCPCVPQTVIPVACQHKYELYYTAMLSAGYSSEEIISEELFCGFNLQYITDGYLTYLELYPLGHPRFL